MGDKQYIDHLKLSGLTQYTNKPPVYLEQRL